MRFGTALRISAALAFGLLAVPGPAAPAPQPQPRDTIDEALPTQLPRTAIPRHYAITVTPNADKLAFDGSVAIDLQVTKATRTLVLNAADLAIAKASLAPAGGSPIPGKVTIDAKAQTIAIDVGRTIAPGAYRLDIDYSGKINTQANGLFALDYKNKEGRDARALYTQFEAADARRFVPSWDEPDYKATFELTARVPSGWMAVSNMPASGSSALPGGLKEVRFPATPEMSTYLLFLAAGDLERISMKAGQHDVGIVTTRGNAEKARYALEAEAQVVRYYEDYFGTPYTLPKLDNVAGPGQSQFFGAMENWGAIFTFEYILLLDPAITSEADRQGIFSVQAHEIAHQWFGDLVTMAWWDDLWLNEGFTSWMENRTTQHFHPDWGADVDQVASRENAMALDSFKSTHAIVQEVRTVEQANQAFDAITYQKGESVISMLEGFAGRDVWRAGIRDYMKKHAFRNTRTTDLWNAVEGAGAKGLPQIAADFTVQPGIPLIMVGPSQCVGGRTTVTLTQSQFSNDRREETSASPLSWHVPVGATAGGEMTQVITDGRSNPIEAPGCGPLLINAGQTGYFRTLYRPEQARVLQHAFGGLGAVNQYGLLTDNIALSYAAYQPMAVGLDFIAAVRADSDPKVVQGAVESWSKLYDDLDGNPAGQAGIAERVRKAYGPLLQRIGFVPRLNEKPTVALLRSALIATLGKFQDAAVIAEATRLFSAWQTDPNAIPGSLKETWLLVLARNADAATWDALRAKAKAATSATERSTFYELLGRTADETLARRALELALTDEPGKTTSAGIITAVSNRHSRLAVDFMLANLARVNPLIDASSRSRFIQNLTLNSADASLIPIIEAYAAANLAESDRAPIRRSADRIRFDVEKRRRIAPQVAEWLRTNPA